MPPSIGAPMVTTMDELITAMVITTCQYADVADTICSSRIRHQRAAERERGRG